MKKVLIANRGEIAVRIARTAAEMGLATVAVAAQDEADAPHSRTADEAVALPGSGPAAYLDADALLEAARSAGCDALHPGYGFLSESAALARACEAAGLLFVGPSSETLALFGDKVAARDRAAALGVPTVPGLAAPSREAAARFVAELPEGASALVKAAAGGGGRGMRLVSDPADLDAAWADAEAEAKAAFGDPTLYVERYLPRVRHVEVQVLGDGREATHFGERECTPQRRHQKLIEVAPCPSLGDALRQELYDWSLTLARDTAYRGLGTFEFLWDTADNRAYFIEANPRIQVEHPVTEEVFGVDLVRLQLAVVAGARLADLPRSAGPRGFAVEARINMERMEEDGALHPTGGVLTRYEPPSGRGVRVDGFARQGLKTSPRYDSLLAKVIVHTEGDYAAALAKADRALAEFAIEGAETNIPFLRAILRHPKVRADDISTRFVEGNVAELARAADTLRPQDCRAQKGAATRKSVPPGTVAVEAPLQATVVSLAVGEGDSVRAGQTVALLEAMKMQHAVMSPASGTVARVLAEPGETLLQSEPLMAIEAGEGEAYEEEAVSEADLDAIRPDLKEVFDRAAFGLDENRSDAVAKRRAKGHNTARENLALLVDEGSFIEYGAFAIAAQSGRRSRDDLVKNTSGDAAVTGVGTINGDLFDADKARCALSIYDYMVLAGTQGQRNHKKQDRIFALAAKWQMPMVLFAEGGGGRPGDTDRVNIAGLDNSSFGGMAALSGHVPTVGVVSGRCFAGNAALVGCCDVIIADESANLGMAGPAMIEGGGLGAYPPEAVGPIDVQWENGVVDVRVADETEACAVVKRYLSYFQGSLGDWAAPDPRRLRRVIPEDRLRVYEIRTVIDALCDEGSVLELRGAFGVGVVTALVRIEGRPFGLIANNPKHLGGAVDAPAADKAARFMQLCDAFDVPMIALIDTPGFMVGPEAEKTGLVRHVCRMFVTGASLSTPVFAVVLRKGYGLGAMAMAAGGFHDPVFTVAWPTGEFGGMGLEGAVRLGYRKELEAEADPAARQALYDRLVGELYAKGKAVAYASALEIDAVIDPMRTREWIMTGLKSVPPRRPLAGGRRPFVDTW